MNRGVLHGERGRPGCTGRRLADRNQAGPPPRVFGGTPNTAGETPTLPHRTFRFMAPTHVQSVEVSALHEREVGFEGRQEIRALLAFGKLMVEDNEFWEKWHPARNAMETVAECTSRRHRVVRSLNSTLLSS